LRLKIADKKANLLSTNYQKDTIKNICLKVYKSIKEEHIFKVTDLDISGIDVMRVLNIPPSRKVGEVLNYLLELVLEDPNKNKKEILEEVVRGL
jgi:tRNA nucleotidyltransferase (CCA-adding enzyme)